MNWSRLEAVRVMLQPPETESIMIGTIVSYLMESVYHSDCLGRRGVRIADLTVTSAAAAAAAALNSCGRPCRPGPADRPGRAGTAIGIQ